MMFRVSSQTAKAYKHGRDLSLLGEGKRTPGMGSGKPPGSSFASPGKVPVSSTRPGLLPLELENQSRETWVGAWW